MTIQTDNSIINMLLSSDIKIIIDSNDDIDNLFLIIYEYNKVYNNFYKYHIIYSIDNNKYDYIEKIFDLLSNNKQFNLDNKNSLNSIHYHINKWIKSNLLFLNFIYNYFYKTNKIIKSYINKFMSLDNLIYFNKLLDLCIKFNDNNSLNYIKSLILQNNDMNNILVYLDVLKDKKILDDHYLSYIIAYIINKYSIISDSYPPSKPKLKNEYYISIIMNDYVINKSKLLNHLISNDISNIKYICDKMNDIHIDDENLDKFIDQIILHEEYYNPLFHNIISKRLYDMILNGKTDNYNNIRDEYKIYFLKYFNNDITEEIKNKLVFDKYNLYLILDDLDYNEYIHNYVYDFINKIIDEYAVGTFGNIKKNNDIYILDNYIIYYLKYKCNDNVFSYKIKELLLKDKLLVYKIINNTNVVDYDKFINIHNLLNEIIYDCILYALNNKIEDVYMLKYIAIYYKDKMMIFDDLIRKYVKKHHEIILEFCRDKIKFDYYYELEKEDDIIYQYIYNFKIDDDILRYYLYYYKKETRDKNMINKILKYINKNMKEYHMIDLSLKDYIIRNKRYIKNRYNRIESYIEDYDNKCKIIEKNIELPQDIINIIYDYSYININE